MCEVAGRLTAAQALTQEALAKTNQGDTAGAAQLATQAAEAAQEGHDRLQTITATDVREGGAWQALLKAYLHVGQAANAFPPKNYGGPAMAASELQDASGQFHAAESFLPATCFTATAQSSQ